MKLLAILLACLISHIASAELIFHPLKHKAAQDIIPVIQPFLQRGESIGAASNELILRLNKKNIRELTLLINKLDKPNHRLVIHVNRDGNINHQQEGIDANSRLNIGLGPDASSSYKGRIKVYSSHQRNTDNNKQSIQVLEGHTAHISSGVSEPVRNISIQQYGAQRYISSNTQYKEASNGFYVTPRLSNDSVILEIAPWYEEPLSKNRTHAKFTRASTVVRGRLNTWIELVGINEHGSQSSADIISRRTTSTTQHQSIWLKVVDLDAIPAHQPTP